MMAMLLRRNQRYPAIVADAHGGHRLGLLNPDTQLLDLDWIAEGEDEDEAEEVWYTPELTETQVYLWELYEQCIADHMREAHGLDVPVWFNGDVTNGNKHPSGILSTRIADQVMIGYYNALPWFRYRNVKRMRFVVGTEAHNLGQASTEILLVEMLRREFPDKDIRLVNHHLADVSGVLLDVAHHGPGPGSREWLHGNVARYYLRDHLWAEWKDGIYPPRLYVRAHYHAWVRETMHESFGRKPGTFDLIVCPSMAGMNEFARQVTKSEYRLTNGIVSLAVDKEKRELCRLEPLIDRRDLRLKESM
jgi:hypothetical protein